MVTPCLPGDSLLFVAGALAATSAASGGLEIEFSIAALLAAAILGDNTNYWIGHYFGPRVFRWEQSRFFNRAAFDKTHAHFEHHGGKTTIALSLLPAAIGYIKHRRKTAASIARRYNQPVIARAYL